MRTPPAPAAREATKRETREALITAGMLEFAEHGLDAPSLDAICARAGKTRGAFYVHFADRDELVAAVFERILTGFHDAVIAPAGGARSLQETVAGYVAAVTADSPAVRSTGPWTFHHTLAACARSPELRRRYGALQRQAIERVTRAARAGQAAGTVRTDVAAERLGELLVILTLGIAAMREVEAPFDLAGGAAALAQLLAPVTSPRRRRARPPRPGRSRARRRSCRRRRRACRGGSGPGGRSAGRGRPGSAGWPGRR
jgi:TetR/AcrR family transcriptional regulator, transcriptional repressor for nem operon